MLQTDMQVLDKIVALNLNINLWSARKKITFEDVDHIPNGELPPNDLATLGSKKIAPPESLRIFTTLKARAVSLLDRYGLRFMSGWAIPENLIDEVGIELNAIRDEFLLEKDKFLNEYDRLVGDWVSKHPQWKDMLQKAIESPDYIRSRMSFSWQVYKVQSSANAHASGLEEVVQGLGSSLFDDVAKTADEIWNKVYDGKDTVTHKALSPLKNLYTKLVGLSFVEPHIMPVALIIENTISRIPKRGNIVGEPLQLLQNLVQLLKDKNRLINLSQKCIQTQDVESIIDEFSSVTTLPFAAYNSVSGDVEVEEIIEENKPAIVDSMGLW